MVGSKPVRFSKRTIRDKFQMFVPERFSEDRNLLSNYTYLFNIDKSPLSIAIKYTSAASEGERGKQIGRYFNQDPQSLENLPGGIYYRDMVTGSRFISVYSLRFAIEVPGGVLFGCFSCAADYKDDWHDVVLQMLQSVEILEPVQL